MQQIELPYHEAGILTRLVAPDEPALSPGAAAGILALSFSPKDKERMHTLAAKARAGALTPDEQAEVEAYSRVGSLLGVLKSRARRALKGRGAKDKAKSR
jgi:hypothetical protein